jgi:hypothetical protein
MVRKVEVEKRFLLSKKEVVSSKIDLWKYFNLQCEFVGENNSVSGRRLQEKKLIVNHPPTFRLIITLYCKKDKNADKRFV